MSSHSFFAPSKAHMWMECFGALAMPQNQSDGTSSSFADDGTASHTLGAWTLQTGRECNEYPAAQITVGGKLYAVDEDRCGHVQSYVDDVRRRALGGVLWVEYRVDLSEYLGYGLCWKCGNAEPAKAACPVCKGTGEGPQGGTSDAVIYQPVLEDLTVEDLKYGTGEKVYACYGDATLPPHKRINKQGGLYLLGALRDVQLLGNVKTCRFVVHQPRLNWIDEYEISIEELMLFAADAAHAVRETGHAMTLAPNSADLQLYLKPGEKTCRWCNAKATCSKLAAWVADEVRADFDTIAAEPPMVPVTDTKLLGKAMIAVPLVEMWCKAVKAEVHRSVATGREVIGPDGKPYKYVEGDLGKRAWVDPKKAEDVLMQHLGPEKMYQPQEIITAPAAGKILDKKATKKLWADIFVPLIDRKRGAPQLALGSDSRPPYTGAASAEEFNDDIEV